MPVMIYNPDDIKILRYNVFALFRITNPNQLSC